MNDYIAWLMRRARRTGWLLRDPATRAPMARYLLAHTAGAGLTYGRGAVRGWLRPAVVARVEER
jgi:hypothetical protein